MIPSEGSASMSPLVIEMAHSLLAIRTNSGENRVLKQEETRTPALKPIVKWAGGKQWIASATSLLKPPEWKGRYYEPFLGGGAFFFALKPARATLSDSNEELISTYRTLRSDPAGVIRLLSTYPYEKNFYYRLRASEPNTPVEIAARFLYLNKTCWNGLYRVNQDGKFNTPFGRLPNPTICDSDRLRAAAKTLRKKKLRVGDFAEVVSEAQSGDFVYFDPPYVTGHRNNGFLKYNSRLFAWEDQERLARCARRLSQGGAYVLVSNADHPEVVKLYEDFNYYQINRLSLIARNKKSRGVVTEALLSNYPILDCKL